MTNPDTIGGYEEENHNRGLFMDSPLSSRPSRLIVAPRTLSALLAAAGILLSLLLAATEAQRYRTIERMRSEEIIDRHFGALTDHLARRENLARTLATLFQPPDLATQKPLSQFAAEIHALAPDLASMAWLPEILPSQIPDALQSFAAIGLPAIRGADGAPLSLQGLQRPLYPIVDVIPEAAHGIIGLDAGDFPDRLAAIRQARDTRKPARSDATTLRLISEIPAFLIYAPVFRDGRFRGVIGFGYTLDELVRGALSGQNLRGQKQNSPFGLRIIAADGEKILFAVPEQTNAETVQTEITRKTDFAGRRLHVVYTVPRDFAREGLRHGIMVALIGFGMTGIMIFLLAFLSKRAAILAREVAARREIEDRLKVLIHELNHRVRNVMTVAQAVVRLSFTPGYSLAEVQKTCEGRLQALASAMTILTDSDWRSVSLRRLISADILPFPGRIIANGPDIALRPRAAQTFALLLYELATNAAKHGALSVPEGQVFLQWDIVRQQAEPLFRMVWLERGGPAVVTPQRRGFGELLVRRIAPRDVAGHSKVSYENEGLRYELEAPLKELLDSPDLAKPAQND